MSGPGGRDVLRRLPVRWLVRQLERFFALVGLAATVYWACLDESRIVSESMAPTLKGTDWASGDRVLTEKISFWFRKPRRWEVIAIRRPEDGGLIMKRVVGLPGETVQMRRNGQIVIDGQVVPPPAELAILHYFPFGNLCTDQKAACGNGYYVLGDFSRDSDDSRFNGPVPPGNIVGRPWVILGPAGRRGFVR
jgi:signal peptidase I